MTLSTHESGDVLAELDWLRRELDCEVRLVMHRNGETKVVAHRQFAVGSGIRGRDVNLALGSPGIQVSVLLRMARETVERKRREVTSEQVRSAIFGKV